MTTISVIIATYNRSVELNLCLDDIFKQKNDGNFTFDVIIVDNNSSDTTRDVVLSFEKKFPGQIRYIFEPKQGKCNALNTGILASRAEIIAFTDDDVRVDQLWLANMINCFQKQNCDGVGGRILAAFPPQVPVWIKENISLLAGCIVVYDYGTETKLYQKPAYEFLGANYAFKRQVFDDCGLFRADIGPGKGTFGDDTEFVSRTLRSGKKLFYCGEALVWHPVDIERTRLKYIAQWNMALGRYRIIIDEKGEINLNLTYYFGIPRHLIKEIFFKGIGCIIHVFNKKDFLSNWISLFRDCGKAIEIQKIYRSRSKTCPR